MKDALCCKVENAVNDDDDLLKDCDIGIASFINSIMTTMIIPVVMVMMTMMTFSKMVTLG